MRRSDNLGCAVAIAIIGIIAIIKAFDAHRDKMPVQNKGHWTSEGQSLLGGSLLIGAALILTVATLVSWLRNRK